MSGVKLDNRERAEVLVQALPHIRRYSGKTIVVKYGGNAMISEELKHQVMEDIVLLSKIGIKVVLVHGGGPEISEAMKRAGKEPEFVDGLRVTDEETMEIVQEVLAGRINKTLVNLLQSYGGLAIGISGMDGRLIQAKQKDPRLGCVGEVVAVDPTPVRDILDCGYIPVISTLGCDMNGKTYNINGDTAAARIAGSLGAERLIMMTDISGIMMDPSDPDSLILDMSVSEAASLEDRGIISGGMIPKVRCCVDAISHDVGAVTILDGRVPHAMLMEILTNEGAGTMVHGDRPCLER
jgi:acetylglutamate kinase